MAKQATSVIYQDPTGNSRQGYIIDGKTYNDPAGTERIAVGSTVPTAGGTYTLTAAGSVKTPGSVADDISRAYAAGQAHLTNANTQRQKAINAATQKSLDAINAQRKQVNNRYADTNRNTYNAYVSASNPYGAAEEQRAKLGLSNSGYAESSKLSLANTYQSSLAENARARDQYLNELDTAYREAKSNGDIQLANAIAEYEMLVYQHGIDAAEAIANQNNLAYNAGMDANEAMWKRKMYEEEQRRERDNEIWERAYKMATHGFSNENIAKTLGISLEELHRVINRG